MKAKMLAGIMQEGLEDIVLPVKASSLKDIICDLTEYAPLEAYCVSDGVCIKGPVRIPDEGFIADYPFQEWGLVNKRGDKMFHVDFRKVPFMVLHHEVWDYIPEEEEIAYYA